MFKKGDKVVITHWLYGDKKNGKADEYPGIVDEVVTENGKIRLLRVTWYKWGWNSPDTIDNSPEFDLTDIRLMKPGEFP